jgi:hypothetical protein
MKNGSAALSLLNKVFNFIWCRKFSHFSDIRQPFGALLLLELKGRGGKAAWVSLIVLILCDQAILEN